jgi:hypothetical protein
MLIGTCSTKSCNKIHWVVWHDLSPLGVHVDVSSDVLSYVYGWVSPYLLVYCMFFGDLVI